eukprot:COSAG05_NODE_522_length_9020_cov_18.531891_10_plen_78_part_00
MDGETAWSFIVAVALPGVGDRARPHTRGSDAVQRLQPTVPTTCLLFIVGTIYCTLHMPAETAYDDYMYIIHTSMVAQ